MAENVFVRGISDSSFEGMTKQEIITAIVNAIQGGTVGNVDTGFVTTIKEQNKGIGLMFWVGTTAEFEALEERPLNTLYIKIDDTSVADINAAIAALQAAIANCAPTNHRSSAKTYGTGTLTEYGHVKLTTNYTQMPPATPDFGVALDESVGFALYTLINDATADSGWQSLTITGTGFSAGNVAPQYRKIGKRVFLRGQISIDTAAASPITTIFTTLPEGYRPSVEKYQLLAGEGDRMARLYIRPGGGVNINYFKEYDGTPVSGTHWVQIDTEFMTN